MSAKYMATTNEVIAGYCRTRPATVLPAQCRKEFDRWLTSVQAAAFEQGAAQMFRANSGILFGRPSYPMNPYKENQ